MTIHPHACRLKKELQSQTNLEESETKSDLESDPESGLEEQNTDNEFDEEVNTESELPEEYEEELLWEFDEEVNTESELPEEYEEELLWEDSDYTVTPIQNDLQELMPTIFEANNDDVQDCFGARKDKPQDEVLMKIQNFLKPVVMRRDKYDVLGQLPPKRICVIKCDMAQAQAQDQLYKNTLSWWQSYARSKTTNEDISNALTRQEMSNIFCELRKISNHPLLLRRFYTNEQVEKLARKFHELGVFGKQCTLKSVCKTLSSYTDYDLHKLCEEYGGIENGLRQLPNEFASSSTKCRALARLLFKLYSEGHRCLLFSQWTKILDILEWALNILGYTFIRLDGKTKVEDRQDLVNEFNNNNNIFIFLISSRAGGQGLNLVGADTIIIHDLDFNPQVNRQAEDSCHHIGQSKPITVYKLVTDNSVDTNIFDIAEKKLTLDAAILQTPMKTVEGEIVRKILSSV